MRKIIFFLSFFSFIAVACNSERDYSLAPNEGSPLLNTPQVTANRANTEFVYAIPTFGERPIQWSVEGLPEGLSLDAKEGIISGTTSSEGDYYLKITAKNVKGKDSKNLILKVGEKLALTPVMGWNSWNTFGPNLNEQLLLEVDDAMVKNGMRDAGYNYVNIDDYWQLKERGADGHLIINSEKFPRGISFVADYLHARGLRLGIYSDASEYTCGGVAGSYGFEEIDAADFAKWGVDLLKYDYCGAPADQETAIKRYQTMNQALKNQKRTFIYSVCEWGRREPWLWAAEVGGHYWRPTYDIRDFWGKPESYGALATININKNLSQYARAGRWNDPDMLVVGIKGKRHISDFTGSTVEEYRSHFSLWCMMASPLLAGNDIRNMNDTITNILTNPEIIKINQDALGIQGEEVLVKDSLSFWTKPLDNNKMAIGILNLSSKEVSYELNEALVGEILSEKSKFDISQLRDVWKHQNVRIPFKGTLSSHAIDVFVTK